MEIFTNNLSMKEYLMVFVMLILLSCKVLVPTPDSFYNSVFVWDGSGMIGSDTISFSADSTFVYSQRNGLFVSYGLWYFSDDGKSIIIKSFPNNDLSKVDDVLHIPINTKLIKEFSILSRDRIRDSKNAIFRRQ